MSGLYIHIPYCHAKCWYCDFYSTPHRDAEADLVALLQSEWISRRDELCQAPATIYFGGGTPSILTTANVARLAQWLPKVSGEFTVEMNPEDVNMDKLLAWREAGANRLSMGVQSLVDEELTAVGRRHTADEAIKAYQAIRSAGFDNVSLDLMMGLPGQTPESFAYSLERILDLRPEHVSAYILSYEPGTRLTARVQAGKLTPTSDEDIERMYTMLCHATRRAGYEHYEISNFALPERRARHNSAYWRSEPYLGLGPSAHSLGSDGKRRVNPLSISKWADGIRTSGQAYDIDPETATDRINDTIMTALRTAEGLRVADLPPHARAEVLRQARALPPGRAVTTNPDCADTATIRIPEAAWLLSDDTIARLFID